MVTKLPKHKTVFAAHIRAIQPTDEDVKEVKASLSDLKQMLPAGIDPEQDFDLLYIAGNLTVAGVVNLNDDGVDLATSLATYKQFERRFVDIEHDRKRLCGYILHAGLSEFGTDKPITEDEARAANKPFNIAIVAVLWKVANPEMCAYIMEASSPTHSDYKALSLSFEVGFEDYKIIGLSGGNRVIADAMFTIEPESQDFSRFDSRLRVNKGDGSSPDDMGTRLYRVLKSDVSPLGGGVVGMPAAPVKGLTVISKPNVPVPAPVVADDTDDAAAAAQEAEEVLLSVRNQFDLLATSLDLKSLSQIILPESSVSVFTTKPTIPSSMKNLALKSVQDQLAKATKIEEVKEIFASNAISDIIAAESVRLEAEKNKAEALASDLQAAKDAAEALNAQAQKDLETLRGEQSALKSELDTIKAAQVQAAAQQKFQERMTALDQVFDLDDETRAYFLEDVKSCASDEAFAKMMDKNKKFLKEKTKDFKKQKADDDKKKDDDSKAARAALQSALESRGVKAKVSEAGVIDFEEVIASAVATPVNAAITNIIAPTPDLKDRARAAFAEAFTIGGKTAAQIVKKDK